ncbi:MAG: metal ABC transporter ATP-binding protein [Stellaceae bacterium]
MGSADDRLIDRARIGGYAGRAWQAAQAGLAAAAQCGRALFQQQFDGGHAPGTRRGAAPAISVSDLTVAYQARPAIENLTLDFPPGSMTAIVGPNGAGKSTLLKAIAGILRPRAGRVVRGGASLHEIGYLPQSDEVDRSFPVLVGEFVALGGWSEYGAFAPAGAEIGASARRALDLVGLGAAHDQPIDALSVGQFRRALFARLALQQAGALLLDEPFAAIDATTSAELLRLVEGWHEEGRTVIAVLHDLAQVRAHFPRTVLLARTCLAAGDTGAVLTDELLARAGFGREPERAS